MAKLYAHSPSPNEKHFVRVLVLVPDKLALEFHDLHFLAIQLTHNLRPPMLRKGRELFQQGYFFHGLTIQLFIIWLPRFVAKVVIVVARSVSRSGGLQTAGGRFGNRPSLFSRLRRVHSWKTVSARRQAQRARYPRQPQSRRSQGRAIIARIRKRRNRRAAWRALLRNAARLFLARDAFESLERELQKDSRASYLANPLSCS